MFTMSVLWLLTLLATTQGDIIIRSIQDTTFYAENLKTTVVLCVNEDDMKLINKEFDKLCSDNCVMAGPLGNQTRIMKTWISSSSHDLQLLNDHSESHIKQLNDIINTTNTTQKNIVVGNIIALRAMAVEELSEDLNLLINAINDGKTLISELRKIKEDLITKYPVKFCPKNYQHIIDISEISIGIIKKRLVYKRGLSGKYRAYLHISALALFFIIGWVASFKVIPT